MLFYFVVAARTESLFLFLLIGWLFKFPDVTIRFAIGPVTVIEDVIIPRLGR